jgi:hypothetical protein
MTPQSHANLRKKIIITHKTYELNIIHSHNASLLKNAVEAKKIVQKNFGPLLFFLLLV